MLRRTRSAADHASGCPGLPPAPADLPLGQLWPALSDLVLGTHRCGVSALPAALRSHPRVRLRDKGGALAQRDPFFSFFDHVVQSYRAPLGGKKGLQGRPARTSTRLVGRGWPELGAA